MTTREEVVALLEQAPRSLPPLEGNELVIYGAGGCGRSVAMAARARGWRVLAFLDARAAEIKEVDGVACYTPEAATKLTALPVVVAVFNYATDLRPIFARLQAVGFSRVVSFYQAHEQFGMEPQYWLGSRQQYRAARAEILAAFDLFPDETSQRVFRDYLALRVNFDLEMLASPDQANHYVPADLPPLPAPLRMIDGGAFNGDTIELFSHRGARIDALAAFEPDPKNFADLCRRVRSHEGEMREIILFPCGLSARTTVLRFASGTGASSSLESDGDTAIQVVALDDVLPTFAPSFIKLDIEGAEPDALRGAARMIERFAPRLAVCVYHAPEHLWTLPQLVRELRPDYRLALRHHQFNGFDVVLYATPSL